MFGIYRPQNTDYHSIFDDDDEFSNTTGSSDDDDDNYSSSYASDTENMCFPDMGLGGIGSVSQEEIHISEQVLRDQTGIKSEEDSVSKQVLVEQVEIKPEESVQKLTESHIHTENGSLYQGYNIKDIGEDLSISQPVGVYQIAPIHLKQEDTVNSLIPLEIKQSTTDDTDEDICPINGTSHVIDAQISGIAELSGWVEPLSHDSGEISKESEINNVIHSPENQLAGIEDTSSTDISLFDFDFTYLHQSSSSGNLSTHIEDVSSTYHAYNEENTLPEVGYFSIIDTGLKQSGDDSFQDFNINQNLTPVEGQNTTDHIIHNNGDIQADQDKITIVNLSDFPLNDAQLPSSSDSAQQLNTSLLGDMLLQVHDITIDADFSVKTSTVQYDSASETCFKEELNEWSLDKFMFHAQHDTLIKRCLSYFQQTNDKYHPVSVTMATWPSMQTLKRMFGTINTTHRTLLELEKTGSIDLSENDHTILELFCKKLSTDIHYRLFKKQEASENEPTPAKSISEKAMRDYTDKLCSFLGRLLNKKIPRTRINAGMLAVFTSVLKITDCICKTLAYLFYAIVRVADPINSVVGFAMASVFSYMYRGVHITSNNHTSPHILAMLSDYVGIATLRFSLHELWALDSLSMLPIELAYVNMLCYPHDKQIVTFLFLYVKTFRIPNVVIHGELYQKVYVMKNTAEKLLKNQQCVVMLGKLDYIVQAFNLCDGEVRIQCAKLAIKAIESIKRFPFGEIDLINTLIDMGIEEDFVQNFFLKSKIANYPTVLNTLVSKFCKTHESKLRSLGFVTPENLAPVFQSVFSNSSGYIELAYPRQLTTYSSLYAYLNLENNFQTNDDIAILYITTLKIYKTRFNSFRVPTSSPILNNKRKKRNIHMLYHNSNIV